MTSKKDRTVKKVLNVLIKIVFSRALIIIVMLALQLLTLIFFTLYLESHYAAVLEAVQALASILLIYIINEDEPTEFKLTWAVFMCLFPVFGALMYVLIKNNWGMVGLRKKVDKEINETSELLYTSDGTRRALKEEDKSFRGFAHYMQHTGHFPVYHNAHTEFYPSGEETFEHFLNDIRDAKEFIFIEFFIIAKGCMWDTTLELLKEKAAEGVEIRVMYDGFCSLFNLPYNYAKKLRAYGIDVKVFAPIVPFFSTTQNNRDHRKIVVIDGRVAYTGGVNLADEYINKTHRFGHWKDVAIRVEGRAVESFTLMFLQMWNVYGKGNPEYKKYTAKTKDHLRPPQDGFVIPYGDTPTKKTEMAKTVYEQFFATAQEYIHIMTPYFIVDREFMGIMSYASRKGVDVKMIIPHIPDKKPIFYIARTYYKDLLDAGIKVYEYTPGFVHAKVFVSDDRAATVGSVNLDYRSFYHHFECGVYLYENSSVKTIEEDFQATLAKCREVTYDYYKNNIPVLQKISGRVLRLVAPLL